MNISLETLSILSNFASINQNIHIAPGNVIKTKTPASLALIAKATVIETFPTEFSIYELSKFLNTLNLFNEPEIEFHPAHMTISEHSAKANFAYTEKALVDAIKDYDKEPKQLPSSLDFTLTEDTFKRVQKSAKLFDAAELFITTNDDNTLRITASGSAMSKENANKFTIDIDAPMVCEPNISIGIKLEVLKFLPGDYDVSISILKMPDGRQIAMCRFNNISFENSTIEYIAAGEVL